MAVNVTMSYSETIGMGEERPRVLVKVVNSKKREKEGRNNR